MRRVWPWIGVTALLLVVLFIFLVPQWRAPGPSVEVGPRGQAMVQFAPTEAEARAQNQPAPALAPLPADAPQGGFKNVKVLTDVSPADFMRLQQAMTAWVAPTEGCAFCHAPGGDYASDANPRKAAARTMLAMTRTINAGWKSHVGAAGVTCFSCHRGQPVPADLWFQSPPRHHPRGTEPTDDWNEAATTVRTFFPNEGYEEYLLQDTPAHGEPLTALPTGTAPSPVEVKRLYEAMMQMSDGMGVGCVYCHHSRNFADWSQSMPMRWSGYSGIVMTRDLNRQFLLKLAQDLPLTRAALHPPLAASQPDRLKGPQKGNGLADCATCHHGAPKPRDPAAAPGGFPGLTGPAPSPAAVPPPAPAPPPAAAVRIAATAPAPIHR